MINTSAEYKKAVKKNRVFEVFDKIIFKNGEIKHLSKINFTSYSISESTSESNKFTVGAAILKKYSAVLNNQDGDFDSVDFEGAVIAARVGLKLETGRWEILDKGTYRIVSAKARELTIEIIAYDEMVYFDRPYSESALSYPATINQIIQDACTHCHVTYDARNVEMGNFRIQARPDGDTVTFRDIISYCAQIMGCFARINHLDTLCFEWYDFAALSRENIDGGIFDRGTPYNTGDCLDGGNFKDYTSGIQADGGTFKELNSYHNIYIMGEKTVYTDDIRITGIKVTAEETKEEYLQGEEGYVLEITNPLIQSDTRIIAEHIGGKIIGNLFRPLKVKCLSDPSIEAGDAVYVTDRKKNTYQSVITCTVFTMGGYQSVECNAETGTEKEFTRFSGAARLLDQASGTTEKKLSSYDVAVQQMNQLAMNTLGFFQTITENPDGSRITYMHDRPELEESRIIYKRGIDGFFISSDGGKTYTSGFDAQGNAVVNVLAAIGIVCDWIRGGTLTLGGDNNVNGEMTVYDETGKVVGRFNKDGLWAKNGYFEGTIKSQNAEINGGYVNIETDADTNDKIILKHGYRYTNISPYGVNISDYVRINYDGISIYNGDTKVFEAKRGIPNSTYASNLQVVDKIRVAGEAYFDTALKVTNGINALGGIEVKTGDLKTSSTSRVHILNTSSDSLDVSGGAVVSGGAEISKGLSVLTGDLKMESSTATFTSGGNAVLKKSLDVSGTTTLKGSVKIGGSASSNYVGFFNSNGSAKQTIANLATYPEPTISKVTEKINELLKVLRTYGLIG